MTSSNVQSKNEISGGFAKLFLEIVTFLMHKLIFLNMGNYYIRHTTNNKNQRNGDEYRRESITEKHISFKIENINFIF